MSKSNSKIVSATEEEYTVEQIINVRTKNGKLEYYLKWLDYPDSQNTWEPADNLNCQRLLAAFKRKNPAKFSGLKVKHRPKEPSVKPKSKIVPTDRTNTSSSSTITTRATFRAHSDVSFHDLVEASKRAIANREYRNKPFPRGPLTYEVDSSVATKLSLLKADVSSPEHPKMLQ